MGSMSADFNPSPIRRASDAFPDMSLPEHQAVEELSHAESSAHAAGPPTIQDLTASTSNPRESLHVPTMPLNSEVLHSTTETATSRLATHSQTPSPTTTSATPIIDSRRIERMNTWAARLDNPTPLTPAEKAQIQTLLSLSQKRPALKEAGRQLEAKLSSFEASVPSNDSESRSQAAQKKEKLIQKHLENLSSPNRGPIAEADKRNLEGLVEEAANSSDPALQEAGRQLATKLESLSSNPEPPALQPEPQPTRSRSKSVKEQIDGFRNTLTDPNREDTVTSLEKGVVEFLIGQARDQSDPDVLRAGMKLDRALAEREMADIRPILLACADGTKKPQMSADGTLTAVDTNKTRFGLLRSPGTSPETRAATQHILTVLQHAAETGSPEAKELYDAFSKLDQVKGRMKSDRTFKAEMRAMPGAIKKGLTDRASAPRTKEQLVEDLLSGDTVTGDMLILSHRNNKHTENLFGMLNEAIDKMPDDPQEAKQEAIKNAIDLAARYLEDGSSIPLQADARANLKEQLTTLANKATELGTSVADIYIQGTDLKQTIARKLVDLPGPPTNEDLQQAVTDLQSEPTPKNAQKAFVLYNKQLSNVKSLEYNLNEINKKINELKKESPQVPAKLESAEAKQRELTRILAETKAQMTPLNSTLEAYSQRFVDGTEDLPMTFRSMDSSAIFRSIGDTVDASFQSVHMSEFDGAAWGLINLDRASTCPNLLMFQTLLNQTSDNVAHQIVSASKEDAPEIVSNVIDAAHQALKAGNFAAAGALYAGLQKTEVVRLTDAVWSKLDASTKAQFEEVKTVMNPTKNCEACRKVMQTRLENGQRVTPWIAGLSTDLTVMVDGNPDEKAGGVNLNKPSMVANTKALLRACQQSHGEHKSEAILEVFNGVSLTQMSVISSEAIRDSRSQTLQPRSR